MGFDEKHIAEFDAYLRSEMSAEEKTAFESTLTKDAALKAEFESFKLFEATIESAEIKSFKAQLGEWDKITQEDSSSKKTRIIPIRTIAIAASVALIAFLAVNYFFGSVSNQELATNYFSPYENVLTIRGEKETIDDALLLYEKEDYIAAVTLFSSYPKNQTANFYAGECEFQLKNYTKAITYYEAVMDNSDIFYEVAQFHMALAYLGADDKDKSIEVLNKIAADSDYFDEAELLLKDLK